MRDLTVSAGLARGLMQIAIARGANPELLARRSQITPEDLQDRDNRIPLARYAALMKAGQELCHDPALALHYGEAVDPSEISLVGLLVLSCETMVEAVAQLNRHGRLMVEVDCPNGDRFQVTRSEGKLWLVDTRLNPNDFPELTESVFARMVCGTRRFTKTLHVKEIHVTHPAPTYRSEYERIFQVPIVFESNKNALLHDEAWLTQRIAVTPRYTFGILSEHAEALLRSLEQTKSTRGRVERVLIPILHTGSVGMEAVAAKLGLSRQTLFRKLKAEGVTFEQVLDHLRYTMALHYLNGKKVSINETAYLVGFSEPSAFSRAFKRWTGSSPRIARRG